MELIEKYQLKPDSPEVQEALYLEYRPFLYSLANRVKAMSHDPAVDCDDLVQDGFFALLHAAYRFKLNERKSFKRYAEWYIRREMYKTAGGRFSVDEQGKRHVYFPFVSSLDEPLAVDSEITLGETIEDEKAANPAEKAVENCVVQTVRRCVNSLPEKQKQVTNRHYMQFKDLKRTAEELGLSYTDACSTRDNALKSLRRMRGIRTLRENVDYYRGSSLASFNRTHMSTTEVNAFLRMGEGGWNVI